MTGSTTVSVAASTPDNTVSYRVELVAIDQAGNIGVKASVTVPPCPTCRAVDLTGPAVLSAAVSDVTETSATLSVSTNEAATCKYQAAKASDSIVTAEELRASTSSFAVPGTADAGSGAIGGLVAGTAYRVFFICSDSDGNYMPGAQSVSFTTPDTTPPRVTLATVINKLEKSAVFSVTTDEPATCFYVVSREAQTLEQVKAGSSLVVPVAGTAVTATMGGLVGGTSYNVYYVCRDTANNFQTAVSSVSFTTAPDRATETPTLSSPSTNGAFGQNLNVAYSLPEEPRAGTVTITISQAGGTFAPITIILDAGTSAGSKTQSLPTAQFTTLVRDDRYDVTLSYQDFLGNPAATAVSTSVQFDLTRPQFTGVAPFVRAAPGAASCELSVVVNPMDEAGALYVVAVPASLGGGTPTPAEVRTGRGAGADQTGVQSGAGAATLASPSTITISGVVPGQSYNVYAMGVDIAGNDVSTTAAAASVVAMPGDATAPTITVSTTTITTGAATIRVTIDEAATAFALVRPSAESAPTAAEVRARGTQKDLGSSQLSTTFDFTGLAQGTSYVAYVTARDCVPNDAPVKTLAFQTLAPTDTPCVAGSTWSSSGRSPCSACRADSACPFGVATACTTTSDTVCTLGPPCADGTWSPSGRDPGCAPHTTCDGDVQTPGTATSDTVCVPVPCSAGSTWSSTGVSPCSVCRAASACGTVGVAAACTPTSDLRCNGEPDPDACVAGSTWSTSGSAPCQPCSQASSCGISGVAASCTPTSNLVCNTPIQCLPGTFSATGQPPCANCRSCAEFAPVISQCTLTADVVCGELFEIVFESRLSGYSVATFTVSAQTSYRTALAAESNVALEQVKIISITAAPTDVTISGRRRQLLQQGFGGIVVATEIFVAGAAAAEAAFQTLEAVAQDPTAATAFVAAMQAAGLSNLAGFEFAVAPVKLQVDSYVAPPTYPVLPPTQNDNGGMIGGIVGGVFGGICFLILIAVVVARSRRKTQRPKNTAGADVELTAKEQQRTEMIGV